MEDACQAKSGLPARAAGPDGGADGLAAECRQSDGVDAAEAAQGGVTEEPAFAGAVDIRAIEATVERIRRGTYGLCASCGGAIPAGQLAVLPFNSFCPPCAH